MSAMDFTITGAEQFSALMDQLGDRAPRAVQGSLHRSAERVMTISKDQFVPVDTGALRSSGTVQSEIRGNVIEVLLGYGGAASGYAIYVHEINKNYRGGRQWKFLEQPLKAAIPDINTALVEDVNAMLGGK